MTIKTTQKIIKIGDSKGVTIPAKALKNLGADTGDEVEVTIRAKRTVTSDDAAVLDAAQAILKDYHADFKNLAQR